MDTLNLHEMMIQNTGNDSEILKFELFVLKLVSLAWRLWEREKVKKSSRWEVEGEVGHEGSG